MMIVSTGNILVVGKKFLVAVVPLDLCGIQFEFIYREIEFEFHTQRCCQACHSLNDLEHTSLGIPCAK